MSTTETRCPTPRCVTMIEKHGPQYHRVYEHNGVTRCEMCGGVLQPDGSWAHVCVACKAAVEPGTLAGMFVPTKCRDCEAKTAENDKKTGNVCLMCGTVRSRCCC